MVPFYYIRPQVIYYIVVATFIYIEPQVIYLYNCGRILTPASIYLDVGFENLSHFSTSFKKLFDHNPSTL